MNKKEIIKDTFVMCRSLRPSRFEASVFIYYIRLLFSKAISMIALTMSLYELQFVWMMRACVSVVFVCIRHHLVL